MTNSPTPKTTDPLAEKLNEVESMIANAIRCYECARTYVAKHEELDLSQTRIYLDTIASQCFGAQNAVEAMAKPADDSAEALFPRWLKMRDTINRIAEHPASDDTFLNDFDPALCALEKKIFDAPIVTAQDFAAKLLCETGMGSFEPGPAFVDIAQKVLGMGEAKQAS